jgi:hypothetical protein
MRSHPTTRRRLDTTRGRLAHSLAARFSLRLHVSLILLLSVAVGWTTDVVLLKQGVPDMRMRYPLAVVAAYLAFFAGVRLWIRHSGVRRYLTVRGGNELSDAVAPAQTNDRRVDLGPLDGPIDPEGCLVVLAGIAVFFFLGGYLWLYPASVFAEVVLELLLAAGLLKGLRHVASSGWTVGVWRATRWSFGFTLCVALLVAWAASRWTPGATTLPQAIKELKRDTGGRDTGGRDARNHAPARSRGPATRDLLGGVR